MRDPAGFARRAAVAVGATVLVALFISYMGLLVTGKVHIQQSDLLVYYSASHLVLAGHGAAIYSFSALKPVEAGAYHALLLPRSEAVFLYPPFVALVLAPFAAFGYTATYVLWFAVNCLLLAVVLRALARYLRLGPLDSTLLAVAGASFFPVFATLLQGQVSILLLAALTGTFLALRSGREELAGALLALALIKPPYVLPFLLMLLVQRRWRVLGSFTLVAVALALIPMAFLGPSTDIDYFHLLQQASGWHTTSGGFSPQANENLWGFFHLLLPASLSTVAQLVGSATALAGVTVVAHRSRRSVDVAFAVATVAALLVNPHVLIHDVSLLLIPAAIAVHHLRLRGATLPLLLAAYLLSLAAVPLAASFHIQIVVLVMVAMLLWLPRIARQAEVRSATSRVAAA